MHASTLYARTHIHSRDTFEGQSRTSAPSLSTLLPGAKPATSKHPMNLSSLCAVPPSSPSTRIIDACCHHWLFRWVLRTQAGGLQAQTASTLPHWATNECKYLQPREESLQRVNPGVHELPIEHVHVDIEWWVPFSFIAGFPAVGPKRTIQDEKEACSSIPLSVFLLGFHWSKSNVNFFPTPLSNLSQ